MVKLILNKFPKIKKDIQCLVVMYKKMWKQTTAAFPCWVAGIRQNLFPKNVNYLMPCGGV